MTKWWVTGILLVTAAAHAEPQLFIQSHRGGMNEVPENTLAAMKHSWSIPGAVPEVDLRTTGDGVIVCIHDDTAERTTDAGDVAVSETTLAEVKTWDAGAWFDERYAGERVPTLEEVFALMKDDPSRELDLDLKAVDLDQLVALIEEHDMREQVLFVHSSPRMCERLSGLWPGARVMTWISGNAEHKQRRFDRMEDKEFHGLDHLQFHLAVTERDPEFAYDLGWDYLEQAAERLAAKGVALQVRPMEFDARALRRLIDLGTTWFVADDPQAFRAALDEALDLE